MSLRARWRLSRLCLWWLYTVRRYEEASWYATRFDCLVGHVKAWATHERIAPLPRLLRAAFRVRLRPDLATFRCSTPDR